jgi:hypothetical protein
MDIIRLEWHPPPAFFRTPRLEAMIAAPGRTRIARLQVRDSSNHLPPPARQFQIWNKSVFIAAHLWLNSGA